MVGVPVIGFAGVYGWVYRWRNNCVGVRGSWLGEVGDCDRFQPVLGLASFGLGAIGRRRNPRWLGLPTGGSQGLCSLGGNDSADREAGSGMC